MILLALISAGGKVLTLVLSLPSSSASELALLLLPRLFPLLSCLFSRPLHLRFSFVLPSTKYSAFGPIFPLARVAVYSCPPSAAGVLVDVAPASCCGVPCLGSIGQKIYFPFLLENRAHISTLFNLIVWLHMQARYALYDLIRFFKHRRVLKRSLGGSLDVECPWGISLT